MNEDGIQNQNNELEMEVIEKKVDEVLGKIKILLPPDISSSQNQVDRIVRKLQYVPQKWASSESKKKNRVQESVIVEESSTITLAWTLFLTA